MEKLLQGDDVQYKNTRRSQDCCVRGGKQSCCQAGISHLPLLIDGVIAALLLIPSLMRAVEVS